MVCIYLDRAHPRRSFSHIIIKYLPRHYELARAFQSAPRVSLSHKNLPLRPFRGLAFLKIALAVCVCVCVCCVAQAPFFHHHHHSLSLIHALLVNVRHAHTRAPREKRLICSAATRGNAIENMRSRGRDFRSPRHDDGCCW